MHKVVQELLTNERAPFIDCFLMPNGEVFICKVFIWECIDIIQYKILCKSNVESFLEYSEDKKDWYTNIYHEDTFKIDDFLIHTGEGSVGENGFYSFYDRFGNFLFMFFSEVTNPFINVEKYGDKNKFKLYSSYGKYMIVDIKEILKLTI